MKPINGIYPTQCATFPRSGHILVQRVLQEYFGPKLHWTDIHKWPERGFDQDPKCNLEKTHDFDLKTPIRLNRLYLVQIRNPFNALPGWQAMREREGHKQKEWRPWYRQRARYWMRFVQKWVYTKMPNRLIVPYEKLTANPVYAFTRIIIFMTKKEPNLAKLTVVLNQHQITTRESKPAPYESI